MWPSAKRATRRHLCITSRRPRALKRNGSRAAGWLEARTVNDTDDVAFFWTPQAEGALDTNALRRDNPADLN